MRHKAKIAKLTAQAIPSVPDSRVLSDWDRYEDEFRELVLENQNVWHYVIPSQIDFCTTNRTWNITSRAEVEDRATFSSADVTFVKLQNTIHIPLGATVENVIEVMNAKRREICVKATEIARTLYKNSTAAKSLKDS